MHRVIHGHSRVSAKDVHEVVVHHGGVGGDAHSAVLELAEAATLSARATATQSEPPCMRGCDSKTGTGVMPLVYSTNATVRTTIPHNGSICHVVFFPKRTPSALPPTMTMYGGLPTPADQTTAVEPSYSVTVVGNTRQSPSPFVYVTSDDIVASASSCVAACVHVTRNGGPVVGTRSTGVYVSLFLSGSAGTTPSSVRHAARSALSPLPASEVSGIDKACGECREVTQACMQH